MTLWIWFAALLHKWHLISSPLFLRCAGLRPISGGGVDFVPTGIDTGVSGSIFGPLQVVSILTTANFVVPAGCYIMLSVGANITLQVQTVTGGTWVAITAVGVGVPFFCSDGTNIRLQNAGGGTQTATLIKIG